MYFSSKRIKKRLWIDTRKSINARCIKNKPEKLQDTCRKISSEIFNTFQTYHNSGIIDDQLKITLLQSKEKFIQYLHDLEKEIVWYERRNIGNNSILIDKEAENIYSLLITYQERGKIFLETIEKKITEKQVNGRAKNTDVGVTTHKLHIVFSNSLGYENVAPTPEKKFIQHILHE